MSGFPVCMYCGEAEMEPAECRSLAPLVMLYRCPKCGATMTVTTRHARGAASYPPREPFRDEIVTQRDWRPGPKR